MVFNREIGSCDERDREGWRGRSGQRDRGRWSDNRDVYARLFGRSCSPPPYIHYTKSEKKFLASVTRMPLKKISEGVNSLSLYPKVAEWDDSGALEAFQNAKTRFWAQRRGQPCSIPSPDINMFIDEVDYDAVIDPELIEDLNKYPDPDECNDVATKDPVIDYGPIIPSGWGDEEDDKPIVPTGWGDEEDDKPIITTGWGDEEDDKHITPTGWGDENEPVPLNNNAAESHFTGWNDCKDKHTISVGCGNPEFLIPQSDAAAELYSSCWGMKDDSNNAWNSSSYTHGGYANGGSYNTGWGNGAVQDNSWGSRRGGYRRNNSRGSRRGDYADNRGNTNTWGSSNNMNNDSSRKNWRNRDREGRFGFRSMEPGHQAEDYQTANRWSDSRGRDKTHYSHGKTIHPKPPLPNGTRFVPVVR